MERVITQKQAHQLAISGSMSRSEIAEKFTIVDALPDPEPPKEAAPIPRMEQLKGRLILRLLTENESRELKKLEEQEQKRADRVRQFGQLKQQRGVGLITEIEYLDRHKSLTEAIERDDNDLILENDDPEKAKKKTWELYHGGKISLEKCLEIVGPIRARQDRPNVENKNTATNPGEEYHSRRQLLTQQTLREVQPCGPGCGCDDCHMRDFREKLNHQVRAGRITESKAQDVYELRRAMMG